MMTNYEILDPASNTYTVSEKELQQIYGEGYWIKQTSKGFILQRRHSCCFEFLLPNTMPRSWTAQFFDPLKPIDDNERQIEKLWDINLGGTRIVYLLGEYLFSEAPSTNGIGTVQERFAPCHFLPRRSATHVLVFREWDKKRDLSQSALHQLCDLWEQISWMHRRDDIANDGDSGIDMLILSIKTTQQQEFAAKIREQECEVLQYATTWLEGYENDRLECRKLYEKLAKIVKQRQFSVSYLYWYFVTRLKGKKSEDYRGTLRHYHYHFHFMRYYVEIKRTEITSDEIIRQNFPYDFHNLQYVILRWFDHDFCRDSKVTFKRMNELSIVVKEWLWNNKDRNDLS